MFARPRIEMPARRRIEHDGSKADQCEQNEHDFPRETSNRGWDNAAHRFGSVEFAGCAVPAGSVGIVVAAC